MQKIFVTFVFLLNFNYNLVIYNKIAAVINFNYNLVIYNKIAAVIATLPLCFCSNFKIK